MRYNNLVVARIFLVLIGILTFMAAGGASNRRGVHELSNAMTSLGFSIISACCFLGFAITCLRKEDEE